MVIDVSGDTNISVKPTSELRPVHAVQQTASQVSGCEPVHSPGVPSDASITKLNFNSITDCRKQHHHSASGDSAPNFIATTECGQAYVYDAAVVPVR